MHVAQRLGLRQARVCEVAQGKLLGNTRQHVNRKVFQVQLASGRPRLIVLAWLAPSQACFATGPGLPFGGLDAELLGQQFMTEPIHPRLQPDTSREGFKFECVFLFVPLQLNITQAKVQGLVVPHASVYVSPTTQPAFACE